jgi:hypothetical protein
MSEAGVPREWRFYVEDMVSFIDKALAYTQGLERAAFGIDSMRYDATLRNLELSARPRRMSRKRSGPRRRMCHGAS